MSSKTEFDRDRVARVARIYNSNLAAARALRIERSSFSRLCRRYDIETPNERRERRQGRLMVQASTKSDSVSRPTYSRR